MAENLAFKGKLVWFGSLGLVWFGMGFCGQDRKAMSGELLCQI